MADLTTSYLIGRTDRLIRAELEAALLDTGLTLPEYTALSVLRARPGLSNARLARRSLVTPQSMHKVVRSLEDAELVVRTAKPAGSRVLGAEITPKGEEVLDHMLLRVHTAEDRVLHELDDDERRELLRLLTKATASHHP